ncbi:hypothetical protein [Shewanella fidelis]|uniref:Uncharacterized protein n=1 Tax=Shewanella fidelis TaxID=173509 RepID=A0AAW8NPN0_9GAMM|nr:hypothetical protein [Shewanella fidelis]MDR8523839.1 hypothetical protein [Shewanella fidelis]MDW4810387.1 hypothetical protein [Shewanella fidelis]MDW4823725.1 hypothetical protein [Shewanella fidelis]
MTKIQLPQLPPQVLRNISHGLIAVAAIYGIYVMRKAYKAGDELADKATKPIGQLWSDVSAWSGGWTPVELSDLIIQPWYLDDNYKISDEAWRVIGQDANQKQMLLTLFNDRVLKPEYRHLIGQPIGAL